MNLERIDKGRKIISIDFDNGTVEYGEPGFSIADIHNHLLKLQELSKSVPYFKLGSIYKINDKWILSYSYFHSWREISSENFRSIVNQICNIVERLEGLRKIAMEDLFPFAYPFSIRMEEGKAFMRVFFRVGFHYSLLGIRKKIYSFVGGFEVHDNIVSKIMFFSSWKKKGKFALLKDDIPFVFEERRVKIPLEKFVFKVKQIYGRHKFVIQELLRVKFISV